MGIFKDIRDEWPTVSKAPWSFAGLLIGGLVVGFSAGLFVRSVQIDTLESKISLRDDTINDQKAKIDQLSQAPADQQTPEVSQTIKEELPIKEELRFSDGQLSALGVSLRAVPNEIEIQTGQRTPRLMAKQIVGLFRTSGWRVTWTDKNDTSDVLLLTVPKSAGPPLMEAFGEVETWFNATDMGDIYYFYIAGPKRPN